MEKIIDAVEKTQLPVALVTGASSGIGRETALQLAETHLVIAVGRNQDRLDALAHQSKNILPLTFDLDELESIETTFSSLPRLNVLANIAGISPRYSLEDARVSHWQQMMSTNLYAPMELTRAVLPLLKAASSADEPASIVFAGSGASRNTFPYHGLYAASKHALQAAVDTLRKEVEDAGIRVTTVAPGPTYTAMSEQEDPYPSKAPERYIEAATVARSVIHAVLAPADTQITEIWVRPRKEVR